jgi:hypothetical protein
MSFAAVESIVQALLYEGYLLYPYRASALKNRQRWLFGRVLPREFSLAHGETESWRVTTECLILGSPQTELEVCVRFLQLMETDKGNGGPALCEPTERDIRVTAKLDHIKSCPAQIAFALPPQLAGTVTLTATEASPGLFKAAVAIENFSACRSGMNLDEALFQSLLSTHTLLRVEEGEFISLLDPPEPYRPLAASCHNISAWPVLVGSEPGKMLLAAPIILYDYPQVAPESPGDLFDGTEIDEILSLRIQTLTDAEKREINAADKRARAVLERTDLLTEDQLLRLHGRLRGGITDPSADHVQKPKCGFRSGDRVRLRPRRNADALDLFLGGQTATVVSIERDFEDGVHLGVVVDDDPGRDFGEQGLPGHRFFYRPDEVERL